MADPDPCLRHNPRALRSLVFADGRVVWGKGFGAEGEAVGELASTPP